MRFEAFRRPGAGILLGLLAAASAAAGEKGPAELSRAEAVKVLGDIGDRRAVQSVALTTAPERPLNLRRTAVEALSRIGGKGVAKYLVRLLRDEEMVVSHAAFQGLTRLIHARRSDASASREIADLLLNQLPEAEGQARIWMVALLGEMPEKSAAVPLLRLVRSGPDEIRLPALKALVRTGDREAASGLLDVLRDEDLDARLRDGVLSALGSLAEEDLAPELVDLMEERPELAKPMADVLFEITGMRLGPNVHGWRMWLAQKYEGDEGAFYALGITRAEPARPAGETAVEAPRVAAPPGAAEPERGGVSWRLMALIAMGAAFGAVLVRALKRQRKKGTADERRCTPIE